MESTPEAPAALDLDLDVDFRLDEQDLLPDFYEQLSFELPPPTIRDETPDLSRFVRYARNMSRPRISNMGEVEVFLQHHYRPLAEATGLRGEVLVYFWIDELGLVEKALVYRTSGSIALDEVAVELTDIVKFRPAQHRGSPVAVRVMMPIVFQGDLKPRDDRGQPETEGGFVCKEPPSSHRSATPPHPPQPYIGAPSL